MSSQRAQEQLLFVTCFIMNYRDIGSLAQNFRFHLFVNYEFISFQWAAMVEMYYYIDVLLVGSVLFILVLWSIGLFLGHGPYDLFYLLCHILYNTELLL